MTLITRYSILYKILVIMFSFVYWYSFYFIFEISINLYCVLQASNSYNRLYFNVFWVLIIYLIRSFDIILGWLLILHYIVCNLTERFTINIFWVNFLYMTTISWNMTNFIIFICFLYLLIFDFLLISSIALNSIFNFILFHHNNI